MGRAFGVLPSGARPWRNSSSDTGFRKWELYAWVHKAYRFRSSKRHSGTGALVVRCRALADSGCRRQPLRVDIVSPLMTMRNFSIQYTQQRQNQVAQLQPPTKPVFQLLARLSLRESMRRHFAVQTRGGKVACDLPLLGRLTSGGSSRCQSARLRWGLGENSGTCRHSGGNCPTFRGVRAASKIFSRLSTSGEDRRECGIVRAL